MTTLTAEQWQARAEASRRFAQAWHEAVTAVARKLAECLAGAWSVMYVRSWAPQANVERLARHLRQTADPCGRALYLVQQVRLGRTAPMLR